MGIFYLTIHFCPHYWSWTLWGTDGSIYTTTQRTTLSVQPVNNTSQQDFGTRNIYCVSNVTFHAESKYAIKIFPSSTVFIQWPF